MIEFVISPDRLAKIAERVTAWDKNWGEMISEETQNGPIFCQVSNKKTWGQLQLLIIWGSQIWRGATAILINRATNNTLDVILEFVSIWLNPVERLEQIIITEELAWIMKYLIVVSEDLNEFLCIRIGIKLKRLISIPNHTFNQDDEEITIEVPSTISVVNINK